MTFIHKLLLIIFTSSCGLVSALQAAESSRPLTKINIDLTDTPSLQRGARLFTQYCLGCHSAQFMRYSRLAKDLAFSPQQMQETFLQNGEKLADTLQTAMQADDAKRWFGVTPPDLSVIARSRGPEWLYSYLRGFYLDPDHPMGTNNYLFSDTAMPHVMWEPEQTIRTTTHQNFNSISYDLVNFLSYLGEPSKQQRLTLGKWVLLYLGLFIGLSYALKRVYWKGMH